jgi:uncharacterized protein (TIGR02117 family)
MKSIVKKTFKYSTYSVLTLLGMFLLYMLSAFVFGRISVGETEKVADEKIEIYLMNNGVHTDIVTPIRNAHIDWTNYFPFENTVGNDSTANYFSVGWGDKGFYLETPSWSKLKVSTAFKAAFWLSSAAVHTTYYVELPKKQEKIKIEISVKKYKKLISYVKKSLKLKKGKPIFIKTNAVYGSNDAFYEAVGSYSLFHTCNTWVNNGLKASDLKASLWTPFASGIFYQYQ